MLFNSTHHNGSLLLNSREMAFLVTFNSLQIIFGSLANLFEVLFFLRKKSDDVSEKLTLNLAVADFVAVTTYLPWRTYLLHIQKTTGNAKYYTSLFVFCIFNTGNAILLIGFDRFIAITRPLRYRALVTGKVVWFGVMLAWGTAFALAVGHYLSFKKVLLNIHKDYELFLSFLSIGHMIVMSIIYTVILKAARKQVKSVLFLQTSLMNADSNPPSLYRKGAYTSFCIVCLFYATFMPYSVYRIISNFDKAITKTSKRVTWRWLISFTFLNSCLNPYIYFIGMKKFRSGLKHLLTTDHPNNASTSL